MRLKEYRTVTKWVRGLLIILTLLIIIPFIWKILGSFAGSITGRIASSEAIKSLRLLIPFGMLFLGWFFACGTNKFMVVEWGKSIKFSSFFLIILVSASVGVATYFFCDGFVPGLAANSKIWITPIWSKSLIIFFSIVGGAGMGIFALLELTK